MTQHDEFRETTTLPETLFNRRIGSQAVNAIVIGFATTWMVAYLFGIWDDVLLGSFKFALLALLVFICGFLLILGACELIIRHKKKNLPPS